MRKITIFVLLIMLGILPIYAGRYAGDFLMIGAGVRALGMGGAFSALADDGSAIYWNSAGLAQIEDSELSAMHAFMYGNLAAYDHLSYIQPLPNSVAIGFNLTRLNVSNIPYFDEKYLIGTNVDQRIHDSNYQLPGVADGYFNATDNLYQFAFSKKLNFSADMGWQFFAIPIELGLGGNVKFIQRRIKDNMGTGTGIDLGLKLKTDMAVLFDIDQLGSLHWGLSFQDIAGTTITWDTKSENRDEILFNTKFGLAIQQDLPKINSELVLAYDRDFVYKGTHHLGAELNYKDLAMLRMGFYDKNYSCGASICVYGVTLDYALISNPMGISNRLGLRLSF